MLSSEWILILDFGGQYTQLITRAVRRAGVYSEILPFNSNPDELSSKPKGIILSGGPESVYTDQAPQPSSRWLELGIPILGICYGMQWLNHHHGGSMLHGANHSGEYGEIEINISNDQSLFDGIDKEIISWMSHGDSIDQNGLAENFKIIGNSKKHVAAIFNQEKNLYGVQFHPEVSHMTDGQQILVNFLRIICKCKANWGMQDFLRQSHDYVRETVGQRDVLSFVSGGVDSSFVTCLLSQVEGIGNVHAVYIEALMRKGELHEVQEALKAAGVEKLRIVDAKQRFIEALKDQWEPETKRKIIGNLFGELQTEACEELNLNADTTMLAQGTLYTDLIESGKGVGCKAHNIKSHHNVGCKFIEDLKERGQIVEPNQWIFKDEVRLAAAEIGLPAEIVNRQPFPGPGLAIRIVQGREEWVNQEFFILQNQAAALASKDGFDALLLPVKTVGVKGDSRSYEHAIMLQGARNWTDIRKTTRKLTQELKGINRVVFNISLNQTIASSHAVIDTRVSNETVELLQEADWIGRELLEEYDFQKNISQSIFVLFGADPFGLGKRSLALRAVVTEDFMTVTPAVPLDSAEIRQAEENGKPVSLSWECLDLMAKRLINQLDLGAFVIDVTDKPPATTCWE